MSPKNKVPLSQDHAEALYAEAVIPHPSLDILQAIAASRDKREIIELIDKYFLHLISAYSEPTQDYLKAVYFDRQHVKIDSTLDHRAFAFAGVDTREFYESGNPKDLTLHVLPAVYASEIRYRITLIHETAGHMGQLLERLHQVGFEKLQIENQSYSLDRLMEMTSVLIEIPLLKAIPETLLLAEPESLMGKPEHNEQYCRILQRDRTQPIRESLQLKDHTNIPSSRTEQVLFAKRAGHLFASLEQLETAAITKG